jgi:hypothetical protein
MEGLKLTIKSPLGYLYGIIEIPENETLYYLKDKVEKLTGITVTAQRLKNPTGETLETSNLKYNPCVIVHTPLSLLAIKMTPKDDWWAPVTAGDTLDLPPQTKANTFQGPRVSTVVLSSPGGMYTKQLYLDASNFTFDNIQAAAVDHFGIVQDDIFLVIDGPVPYALDANNISDYMGCNLLNLVVHSRKTFNQ